MTDKVVAPGPAVIEQNTSGVVGVLAEALAPIVGVAAANECASVVAALPNIAIVPTTSVEYAPCWQNEHGVHPLNSTTAWRKGAEDDVERLSADDPEIFLGVHYRTPWVAAAAEGEKP